MISVTEAKKIIKGNPLPKKKKTVFLEEALDRILAAPVAARCDVPLFHNSAMDGFAVRALDTREASPHSLRQLKLVGEVRAGDRATRAIRRGEAVRIMTGAMIPGGANAVVMREHAQDNGRKVWIESEARLGENIRRQAEEIHRGECALESGIWLGPAALAFLASVGVERVSVYSPPKVGIVVTGNELVSSRRQLKPGCILETNSLALKSALRQAGVAHVLIKRVKDRKRELATAVKQLLRRCDCLLISGGVSVGLWDFSREILERCGVKTLFWQVAQKPGKPFLFGRQGKKTIFGLPGNPASTLVCFYEYVWPHLRQAMGVDSALLPSLWVKAEEPGRKKKGISLFLRGVVLNENSSPSVRLLDGQESFRLGSFARANCLVALPETTTQWAAGNPLEVHLLP